MSDDTTNSKSAVAKTGENKGLVVDAGKNVVDESDSNKVIVRGILGTVKWFSFFNRKQLLALTQLSIFRLRLHQS